MGGAHGAWSASRDSPGPGNHPHPSHILPQNLVSSQISSSCFKPACLRSKTSGGWCTNVSPLSITAGLLHYREEMRLALHLTQGWDEQHADRQTACQCRSDVSPRAPSEASLLGQTERYLWTWRQQVQGRPMCSRRSPAGIYV